MADKKDKGRQSGPLSNYRFSERLTIRLADWAFYILINAIGRTIRFEIEGWENFEAIEKSGKLPIYSFWHDRIFASTYFFRRRGIAVMTSQSKDGEYIARFIKRLGYATIRGSSTRGGVRALVEMIKMMRNGVPMAFTVDGPKGPRYVAKTGAALLAKKSGNPIMPFCVELRSFWTIRSWDRLQIPFPFTAAKLTIGKPIYAAPDADLDTVLSDLQRSLDGLVLSGERWRRGAKVEQRS